jgi:hypothetical protein
MGLKSTIVLDGKEVPPNSRALFQHVTDLLTRFDKEMQDTDPFVPSVLRDEFQALRSKVMALRSDAGMIASDIERFGSFETAMGERAFRRGQ